MPLLHSYFAGTVGLAVCYLVLFSLLPNSRILQLEWCMIKALERNMIGNSGKKGTDLIDLLHWIHYEMEEMCFLVKRIF